MKEKQPLEKIAQSARQKIEDEIGALLGTTFTLTQPQCRLVSKNDFLEKISGKQIVTDLKIAADENEAAGFLFISARAAIRIGGTLIMLPPAELDELAEKISYDEEIEDSYGEIGNIVAAAYTAVFKEISGSPCLIQKKEQRLLSFPLTEGTVDHLQAVDRYYQVSSDLTLDGKELGPLHLLLPAAFFGLAGEMVGVEKPFQPGEENSDNTENDDSFPEESLSADPAEQTLEEIPGSDESDAVSLPRGAAAGETAGLGEDIESFLELCRVSIQEEVGEVIGAQVTCSEMSNKIIDRRQFYREEASGRQLAATIEVSGDEQGHCYLYLGLKDAIRVGCTLLMLPASELEETVRENSLTSDAADAYNEIVNVICRIYAKVFEKHFGRNLKFVKQAVDQIVPEKITFKDDKPIVDKRYYLHKLTLGLDGQSSGHLQMLLPAELLGLQSTDLEKPLPVPEEAGENNRTPAARKQAMNRQRASETTGGGSRKQGEPADVLIISDADPETERIKSVLSSQGITTLHLTFRDNVNDYLPGFFKVVLLVMSEVNEQSLGKAIKISTSCSLPLVAAGSSWTRSKVLKAVRYGVSDILPSPATDEEISRKISTYLGSIAA